MMLACQAIGHVRTAFTDKLLIPRQPELAPAARGLIILEPPYDAAECLEGLEGVSHLWLIFHFHARHNETPRTRVRPPRLGGNARLGVFASRSPYRPNGLGLSLVRLEGCEPGRLKVAGVDVLDGTPVLDIKPYVPFADTPTMARNAIASAPPVLLPVVWEIEARVQAEAAALRLGEPVVELIEQCLAQNPRPAYHQGEREYGAGLWDMNLRWRNRADGVVEVLALERTS